MKLPLLAFVVSCCAFAQVSAPLSTTTPAQIQTTTVNTSALPGITVGVGGAWNRGQADPLAVDVTLGIRFSPTSNVYSWTDFSTPYAPGNKAGPVVTTATTGLGYVLAQSKKSTASLMAIVQTGITATTTGVSPTFTGTMAAPFKLPGANVWVMPYFKAGSPTLGTNGAVASFVMQPGVQILYGFGK